jgi:phosphoribosylglycinamide formyltransferase
VEYDAEVAKRVMESKPDLVVLAGWMHILSPAFLDAISVPIINLHPALPGAFDGADAIGRAYEAYQKGEVDKTGAMVHRVVKEVDRGEPLVVREVEIKKGESKEDLEARIHEVSCVFYEIWREADYLGGTRDNSRRCKDSSRCMMKYNFGYPKLYYTARMS